MFEKKGMHKIKVLKLDTNSSFIYDRNEDHETKTLGLGLIL